jgi:hypothetical protein
MERNRIIEGLLRGTYAAGATLENRKKRDEVSCAAHTLPKARLKPKEKEEVSMRGTYTAGDRLQTG